MLIPILAKRSTSFLKLMAPGAIVFLAACSSAPKPEANGEGERALTATMPAMEPSDESTPELLRLARAQGEAYRTALDYMVHQQAVDGGEKAAGNMIVAYAIEFAEGYYQSRGNKTNEHAKLVYHSTEHSTDENVHVEVSARDAASNMFIPYLNVKATLFDPDGKEVGTKSEPFMWHPWLYHYGENWRVEKDGDYKLRLQIAAPDFRRHDVVNGVRHGAPVVVEFDHVHIKRGAK